MLCYFCFVLLVRLVCSASISLLCSASASISLSGSQARKLHQTGVLLLIRIAPYLSLARVPGVRGSGERVLCIPSALPELLVAQSLICCAALGPARDSLEERCLIRVLGAMGALNYHWS